MNYSNESIREAESYIEAAEKLYTQTLDSDSSWNPVIVNCIMSMIKSVDALMIEYRGDTNKDHSKTSQELRKLYEDGHISENFKSNTNSVRKWVVDEKTAIQYQSKKVSQSDAEKAIKASKRLLKKTKRELG